VNPKPKVETIQQPRIGFDEKNPISKKVYGSLGFLVVFEFVSSFGFSGWTWGFPDSASAIRN
jgi:hypothetical protein